MLLGIHGLTTMHSNVVADIGHVKAAGFDAIELHAPKLERYMDAGFAVEELLPALGHLKVNNIPALFPLVFERPDDRERLLRRCERLCAAAQILKCPTVQVEAWASGGPVDDDWSVVRSSVARSLAELADIAAGHGVRIALENIPATPVHNLARALEVIDLAGRDNLGIVADTFSLWASGTAWDEVRELDPRLILLVHVDDSMQRTGDTWTNEPRQCLPGDGVVPLREGIAAIRKAGYDGVWTAEVYSLYHAEWDPVLLTREVKRRLDALLAKYPDR